MTKQQAPTLTALLEEKERERKATARKDAKKNRQMVQLLEEHVFPIMPRSLASHYRLGYIGPGYFVGPGAGLIFKPTVDMRDDVKARRALGTITKVVTGLERAGWTILRYPEAQSNGYDKTMTVEVSAVKEHDKERAHLSLTFDGIYTTDRCRLVEKEVIVAATPEHKETKMVVECDY